jgi:prolyl 4-hydroxylase
LFQAGSDECSCGGKLTKGLCVKPIKGNAVLFWSMVSITLPFMEIIHQDYNPHE